MINESVPNWSAFHTGQEVIRGSGDLSIRGLNEQGSAQPACLHALRTGPFCKLSRERKHMRSLKTFFALLVVFMVPGSLAHAQGTEPASKTGGPASVSATREEVNQLRSEVAAQRKTIEELKALVEKLAAGQAPASESSSVQIRPVADAASVEANALPVNAPGQGTAHLMNSVLVQPDPAALAALVDQAKPAAEPKKDAPVTAGWNGEHFFIRSADGQFSISPYGYVNTDYRAYKGDGAPPDTFLVRRARFGFQGSYGSHFDFALLTDAAATTGSVVRDVYLNVRIRPEFQFQAGQFKVPFAQETGVGATNLDFVERGFQSMLYPSAASAFRSPGVAIHGDIEGGVVQYWIGAFNGKGYALANTTNQPEVIGRLRFYPWRRSKNDWLKQFTFGGSIDRARSQGLTHDQSFSAALPDAAYTFFPQFAINGPIQRYNGEFTYIKSRFALRGEYDQLNMSRNNVGSEQVGGLGFLSLPSIIAKAYDISATYLLTGEKRPENGTPRVNRPMFGPDTPGGKGRGLGAWEVAFRITGIHADEPGANFLNYYTPGFVPTYDFHTTEYTMGLNWYPNYWVKYVVNLAIDQLKDPSTIGAVPQNYVTVLQRLQFRF
jgi:phosphate-selective porin